MEYLEERGSASVGRSAEEFVSSKQSSLITQSVATLSIVHKKIISSQINYFTACLHRSQITHLESILIAWSRQGNYNWLPW